MLHQTSHPIIEIVKQLKSHHLLKIWNHLHTGKAKTQEGTLHKFYHEKGVTSNYEIKELADIIRKTCTTCIHLQRTPHQRFFPSLSAAHTLNLPTGTTISHDGLAITGPQAANSNLETKHINIITCNFCNYTSARALTSNSSHEIGAHLRGICSTSGRIPTRILSDTGRAQMLGDVKRLITISKT